MLEARGNILDVDCDAVVVTTNGFVTKNGKCVMGRGIAKQIADIFPSLPFTLAKHIKEHGNNLAVFKFPEINECIITFPVKPEFVINDGTNIVNHAKYAIGSKVPGFHAKAQIEIIEKSLQQLVKTTDIKGWTNVVLPRIGCGAGELDWKDIKPLCEKYLDDRFTAMTW